MKHDGGPLLRLIQAVETPESHEFLLKKIEALRLVAVAEVDEDRFFDLLMRLEMLEDRLCGARDALIEFDEARARVLGEETAGPTLEERKDDAEASIIQALTGKLSGLCATCAAVPICAIQPKNRSQCPQYRQRVPACDSCEFWEVDACMNADRCERGSRYVAKVQV